jgi:hypothetical protein
MLMPRKKYKTPAKARATWRRYRAKNPAKHRARSKAYYRGNAINYRKWQRARLYPTLTRPEPAVCELCSKPSARALCLDHDHVTHEFRGWICHSCNVGLAFLGDNIAGLAAALKYLKGEGACV